MFYNLIWVHLMGPNNRWKGRLVMGLMKVPSHPTFILHKITDHCQKTSSIVGHKNIGTGKSARLQGQLNPQNFTGRTINLLVFAILENNILEHY
jgi:hypothetical protein